MSWGFSFSIGEVLSISVEFIEEDKDGQHRESD
jgi:hypothetical protein